MKIVKLENNNIQVQDTAGRVIKSFTPSGASLEFTQGGEAVGLFYAGSNVFDFYPTEVESTQVLPAAKVAFSGDEEDLLDLLSTSFFFDEVGEENIYPSGYYVDFLPTYGNPIGRTYAANNFFGTIVEIKSNITVQESFLSVAAAGVGSGIAGIYKYNEDTNNWDLAVNIGIFNLAVTGTQYLSYTPIKLTAGIYAYGFVLENSVSINSINSTAQTLIFGRLGINAYLNRMTFPKVYDGTLPVTITATIQASASNNPLIYNKIL